VRGRARAFWRPYWPDGTSMTIPRRAITLVKAG
jgi:hypothetical protein